MSSSIEAKFPSLVPFIQYTQHMVMCLSLSGEIITINTPLASFVGCDEKEIIGKSSKAILAYLHLDIPSVSELLSHLPIPDDESICKNQEGERAHILWSFFPLMSAPETVEGIVLVGENITKLKNKDQGINDNTDVGFSSYRVKNTEGKIFDGDVHILLIEDNKIAQKMIKSTLEYLGCNVDTANNGEQAISLFEQNKYDLIFTDLGLPTIDGYETTKQIRKKERQKNISPVPILGLTAHTELHQEKIDIGMGMNEILIKPLLKEQATQAIYKYVYHKNNTNDSVDALEIQKNKENAHRKHMSIIDIESSMKTLNCTKEMAFEMLELLSNNLKEEKLALENAYKENDIKRTKDLLHKIQGGLHYCGALRLKKVMTEMSKQVRHAQQLSSIKPIYTEFYQEVDNFIDEFHRLQKLHRSEI